MVNFQVLWDIQVGHSWRAGHIQGSEAEDLGRECGVISTEMIIKVMEVGENYPGKGIQWEEHLGKDHGE